MAVDNGVYDRLAHTWWDEDGVLHLLRASLNAGRFGYFRRVLTETLGRDPQALTALDVGCGGGLLAEEFARLGCRVTGIDPSEPSLAAARNHAQRQGLAIDYRPGTGERLPVDDASCDVVYCCDVLEHVDDLDQVLAETARVLRPGGVYLYDTINRTWTSWLTMIVLVQEFPPTRLLPSGLHDWRMFITPEELEQRLDGNGLVPAEYVGLAPVGRPGPLLVALARMKLGFGGYGAVGRAVQARESRDTSVAYMGYALRTAAA